MEMKTVSVVVEERGWRGRSEAVGAV